MRAAHIRGVGLMSAGGRYLGTVSAANRTGEMLLAHYVLFGPAAQPATRVNLLLARDFLLAFAASFGFSPAQAAEAAVVTIIGDGVAVPAEVEGALAAAGVQVQRIAGSPGEIAQALSRRIARGQPF